MRCVACIQYRTYSPSGLCRLPFNSMVRCANWSRTKSLASAWPGRGACAVMSASKPDVHRDGPALTHRCWRLGSSRYPSAPRHGAGLSFRGTQGVERKVRDVGGCSSAGRALHSHCRGQGFEPPQLHREHRRPQGGNADRKVKTRRFCSRRNWSVTCMEPKSSAVVEEISPPLIGRTESSNDGARGTF